LSDFVRDTSVRAEYLSLRTEGTAFGGTSYNLAGLIAHYVRTSGGLAEDEVDAWLAALSSLNEDGAYFFSLNRYGFCAANSAA
jgi:hypothetical protein